LIASLQSVLLCLITAPTYLFVVLAQLPGPVGGAGFEIPDLVFSRLIIFFIFIETIADEQQWRFQRAKHAYRKDEKIHVVPEGFAAEDLDRGFIVSGLWSFCRHPNFTAEQAIWLTLYAWASYDTHAWVNWTGIGAFSLVLLFQGSSRITEVISAGKYPEYSEYQARVGRFIPRFSVKPRGGGVVRKEKIEKIEKKDK
jgi:steroid 5-alpha reductase family enzyme